MIRKTCFTIALVLIIVTLLYSINVAESVKTGDVLEYSFKIQMNYRTTTPKSTLELVSVYEFVECTINLDMKGIMVFEVTRMTVEEIVGKTVFRDININYSVKCNDTETETQLKQQLEEMSKQVKEESGRPGDLSIPLMYRLNETLARTPLSPLQIGTSMTGSVTGIGVGSPFIRDISFDTTVVRTTYRNRPSLLIENRGELIRTMFGLIFSFRGSGRTYTDLTGSIVYYSIGEVEFQIASPSIREAVFPVSISGYVKVELELRNIGQLAGYRTIGLEVRFRENKGEVYISGYEIKLNNYRVDGRKLVLNITGLGLGGVLINLTRGVSVLEILIDRARARYVVEEVGGGSLFRIPIIYSNHVVEIEFSEEISEVREIRLGGLAIELLIALSIIIVIIVVPLAIVFYLLKRFKETTS